MRLALIWICVCVNCSLALASVHAGSCWRVHYFDCHLTICLYDRQLWSLAIDGRETSPSIARRPSAAFKSNSVHRWTCWVLLRRTWVLIAPTLMAETYFSSHPSQPSCHLFFLIISTYNSFTHGGWDMCMSSVFSIVVLIIFFFFLQDIKHSNIVNIIR